MVMKFSRSEIDSARLENRQAELKSPSAKAAPEPHDEMCRRFLEPVQQEWQESGGLTVGSRHVVAGKPRFFERKTGKAEFCPQERRAQTHTEAGCSI
jgi:hypothetical protein